MKLFTKTYFLLFSLLVSSTNLLAQQYSITDFGAKTGNADNKQFIQRAIDKATLEGGTVIVPAGTFMTGTIQLKSNVTLQLNRNSVLKGIANKAAYPPIRIAYQAHSTTGQTGYALIFATKAENIGIVGDGMIDGNGEDPIFDATKNANTMRPYGLLIESSKNVTISGIRMQNSAMWMQRYVNCDFLKITGITVFNHANWNNDGVDIDDCHNVIVADCIIDADDDALCFKSEGDRGVKNVVVTNCILATHASAFKFGTGSTGGFESVQFSNTVIRQSLATNMKHPFKQKSGLTGIDIASTDGALVKDINISNISIDSLENPIFIKLGNRLRRTSVTPKGKKGAVSGINFSQITIKNSGISPTTITGFPDNAVADINFRDIFITHNGGGTAKDTSLVVAENSDHYPGTRMFVRKLPATGFYLRHVKNINFSNVQVNVVANDPRAILVADDVGEMDLNGLKYQSSSPLVHAVILKDTKNVVISSPKIQDKVLQINSKSISIHK